MVVAGLMLLFGDRADSGQVVAGADRADIEGRLRLPDGHPAVARVVDAGGELDDDGTLIVSRSVSRTGRSRAVAGGRSRAGRGPWPIWPSPSSRSTDSPASCALPDRRTT